jgi:hypothetical protein
VADPTTHKHFLEYRERYVYFGRNNTPRFDYDTFDALHKEHVALAAKGRGRDDEEEARFEELAEALFRD